MLKEVAYRGKSLWWAYKALRRLREEEYIELLPRGKNLEQELWSLTDHGFEVVLMDRDDIKEYRYRVHAPAHDYLGTCLQLGDLWNSSLDKMFYTEQMLASLATSNFPFEFERFDGHGHHIPDGVTIIPGQLKKQAIIGYEVDLNLKEDSRYMNTASFYEYRLKPHLVVWMVKSPWMAHRIADRFKLHYRDVNDFFRKYAFILSDDFKSRIWEAQVFVGPLEGHTVRKLHANLVQSLGKDAAKIGQTSMQEIFFPKFRSPQKSFSYTRGGAQKSY